MHAVFPIAVSALAGGLTLAGVVALVLAVAACVNLLPNKDLSGGAKAMWLLIIVFVPILGSIIYFSVRSDW
jgi:hypothetical protein